MVQKSNNPKPGERLRKPDLKIYLDDGNNTIIGKKGHKWYRLDESNVVQTIEQTMPIILYFIRS